MHHIYIIPRKSAKNNYVEAIMKHRVENVIQRQGESIEAVSRNVDISRLNEVRSQAEYN